jgi:hypothetical protein
MSSFSSLLFWGFFVVSFVFFKDCWNFKYELQFAFEKTQFLCACRFYLWNSSTIWLLILLCGVGCLNVLGEVYVGCDSGKKLVM